MPILRCGNSGWSGWISEKGAVRGYLVNEEDSVYFQGASVVELQAGKRLKTVYSEKGDYFIALCLIFVILSAITFRTNNKQSFRKP